MMISTGFDRPGGAMALSGVEKFCTVASRAGGWIVQLWRRIGLALGPAALALALFGASALVFAAPAPAQTFSCSGGPVTSTAAKVTYSAVTDTCVISQGGGLSIEAGALTFYMYNNSQHVVQAVRGLGSGNVISGLSVCNFGDGGGNISPAQCEETNYSDATDLVGTFEWDSTNPGAPVSSDRRMVVNYRRDGSNYTIQSASVSVIGAAAPEINITGNGNTIDDGDATPTGTDHTLFGNVDVYSGSIERTFTIQNTGTGTLTLGANAVTLSSSGSTAGEFTITQQPATSVAAAGSTTFKVQYDPADFTSDTVTLNIANNDGDENPYNFDITGAPIAVEMDVRGNNNDIFNGDTVPSTADNTDFGSNEVGSGQTFTFEIRNVSAGTLVFGTDAVSIIGSSDFTVTTQPPTTLAPGSFNLSTTSFQITFVPSSVGLISATVSIANNDPDESPYTFGIQGTGTAAVTDPEIEVRGNSVAIASGDTTPSTADDTDFGSAGVGTNTAKTFSIFNLVNTGGPSLVLGANAVTISGSTDFAITTQPATILTTGTFDPQSTHTVITFTPSSAGLKTATVSINNNDPDESPYTFVIQGTGTGGSTEPEIAVTGNGVDITDGDTMPDTADDTDFGSVDITTGMVSRTFTIRNSGTATLNLGANAVTLSSSGSTAGEFTITEQPATSVAAAGSTTFKLQYDPADVTTDTVTVNIANNDGDENPYTFAIQGTGTGGGGAPEIAVTGNSVDITDGDTTPDTADDTDFGSVDITTGMVSRTFTIRNSGTATLNLGANAASLSGANAGDFSITSQPATTVAESASTTVTVQFDPTVLDTRAATLSIANNDADEAPFDFAIQGTGTGVPGGITIVLSVAGPDTSLTFASATSTLNFSLTASGGSAQTNVTGVLPGTHVITAANLAASGYVVTAIVCSDSDSTTDARTRTATIMLGSAESVTCTFTLTGSDGVTSQMIVDYLGARNSFILRNQADRTRRVSRLRGANGGSGEAGDAGGGVNVLGFAAPFAAPVSASINKNEISYSASASRIFGYLGQNGGDANLPDLGRWEFWSEGKFSLFKDESSQSGKFGILHFGADYLVSPKVLVGAKLQIDWMDQRFAATSGKVAGTGYMVGPYATIALDDHFFLDVSGSLGRSSNRISPFGTYTDRFSTTRWMLDAALVGQFEIENWTIQPTLASKYISERQEAYTDTIGFPIPAQTVAQGEISFSPRLSYNMELDNDTTLIPWVEVTGRYGMQAGGSPSAGSFASQLDGLTASLSAGIDVALPGGASFAISGDLDGLGAAAESYGIRFALSVPLN